MHNLTELYRFVRPYRIRLLFALAGMVVFTVFNAVPPLIMKYLVDEVLQPRNWNLLIPMTSAIVGVPLIAILIRYVNMQLLMLTSRRFLAGVRVAMYQRAMNLSMHYHNKMSSGVLVGRLMDDVNRLQRLLTGETVQILIDVIVFFFSLVVTFIISWKLALILCVIILLYAAAYTVFSRRIRTATESFRLTYDQIAGRLQETLAGVRLVRIYNRQQWEHDLFLDRTRDGLNKALSSSLASTTLSTISTGIAGYGSTVVAGLGAWYVLRGEMTYGDLHAFNSYVWMAIFPAIRFTTIAAQLSETFVSLRRILEITRQVPDIRSLPGAPRIQRGPGAVSIRDVHFGYSADAPLYQGLTLDIAAGTTVALVGPTGCGKTTLTSLLMRFWDVNQGMISIDGQDVRTVALPSLRRLFGVVLQEPVLFDGTLRQNIAYGRPDASLDDIRRAAATAEIAELAESLPKGYDTMLGSSGVKLSVGEKQRLSIARAVLKDPLILIMDEATSSLDSLSESLIQKALDRILRNRTSFVIAHRLSTIHAAGLIVAMDHGRIVASGTHDELMATEGGLYRCLYEEMLGHNAGVRR